MADSSFNLTAISIFVVVMTVLIGPAVNVPAVVPAIVTATCLGLAAVDNLAWQGRGGTLLVDWVTRVTGGSEYLQRICHHEAGHFLTAVVLGVPVTGYALNAWQAFRQGQPGLGGVTFDTDRLEADLQQGQLSVQMIDRYYTIWMAGTAAEQLVYGDAHGGTDDRQTLRFLWRKLNRPAADYPQKERWALLQAKTLLEQHQAAYTQLVAALSRGDSVQDCLTAIVPLLDRPADHPDTTAS